MNFETKVNSVSKFDYYIRGSKRIRVFGSFALAGFVLLLGLTVVPLYNIQETVEATTGTATESSLTFTSINPTASVSLSVSDPAGTFATSTDAQKAKFTIYTTNYTGYTVTLKSTGTTLTDGTNSLNSIPSTLSQTDFSAVANTDYNNKWGVSPNYYNSSANTAFIPAPASGGLITLDETSAANTTAKEYTIALGVRADYTYAESTYTNTFVIQYVANQINYTINYNANAGTDTVTNMPTTPQTGYTSATSITIASATPERDNYEFKGWCTTSTSDETCSGTTYQPGATYGIDQTTANEITLYAMWESTFPELQIQNLASSACTTTPTEVYDARDNEIYTVARLADGKCWMTTNLNLAGGTVIESTMSDVPAGYTLPTANGFQSGNKLPASATAGFNDNTKAFVYNSNSTACGNNSPCYSYYSWTAATAGSGLSITTDNTDAPYSICPAGWKLPNTRTSTNSDASFRALMIAYGGLSTTPTYDTSTNPTAVTMYSKIIANPIPGFLLTGFYSNGTFKEGGSSGDYWSSTSADSTNARRLYFHATSVLSANIDYRRQGHAVRCVLQELDNAVYMQGLSENVFASAATGTSKVLKDSRDNTGYTIAKLADGNVWMLENLRLDPTATTLTPANTNVSSTVTATFTNKSSGWNGDDGYTNAWYNLAYKDVDVSYGSGSNKTGGYYNYCAASAGTYCVSGTAGSDGADSDLCPVGWRMPTGGDGGEYATLVAAITGTSDTRITDTDLITIFQGEAHIGRYGYYNNSSPITSDGFVWASTSPANAGMDDLYIRSSVLISVHSSNRIYGRSVRCIQSTPKIIKFYIGSTEFTAEEGMTFQDYINSKYNRNVEYVLSASGTKVNYNYGIQYGSINSVTVDTVIESGKTYSAKISGWNVW